MAEENPIGDRAIDDETGLGIWCSGLILAQWALDLGAAFFDGKAVIELGAGCGVPGITVGKVGRPSKLILTDLNQRTVANMSHNAEANGLEPNSLASVTQVLSMDWQDPTTWPKTAQGALQRCDVILAADLVYDFATGPLVASVLSGVLKPGGHFLCAAPETGRAGMPEFIASLIQDHGLELVESRPAPAEYAKNPLASGDELMCFLHFHELQTPFRLFHFRRSEPEQGITEGGTVQTPLPATVPGPAPTLAVEKEEAEDFELDEREASIVKTEVMKWEEKFERDRAQSLGTSPRNMDDRPGFDASSPEDWKTSTADGGGSSDAPQLVPSSRRRIDPPTPPPTPMPRMDSDACLAGGPSSRLHAPSPMLSEASRRLQAAAQAQEAASADEGDDSGGETEQSDLAAPRPSADAKAPASAPSTLASPMLSWSFLLMFSGVLGSSVLFFAKPQASRAFVRTWITPFLPKL